MPGLPQGAAVAVIGAGAMGTESRRSPRPRAMPYCSSCMTGEDLGQDAGARKFDPGFIVNRVARPF